MYKSYRSEEISIGDLPLGGNNPVRIQSMANTDTNNEEASLAQCTRMVDAGAELVRFTTQGSREVESLGRIQARLRALDINVPLIADVHFNPSVAEKAAAVVAKVRINPGNYTEKRSFSNDTLSDEEYRAGQDKIREKIIPLLELCKSNDTAIRIGVNHGSLSPRIMLKYGDTPAGMAESAMEFIRICQAEGFNKLVVSMKSSNTRVMVQSVRFLASRLSSEGLPVPLHLGVTEAGDGDEGRIRSAVGIAPLLAEGFGDTIRVSLTEAPEKELPVAAALRSLFPRPESLPYPPLEKNAWDPFSYHPPERKEFKGVGGAKTPVVITGGVKGENGADLTASNEKGVYRLSGACPSGSSFDSLACTLALWKENTQAETLILSVSDKPSILKQLDRQPGLLVLDYNNETPAELRAWLNNYYTGGNAVPVIFRYHSSFPDRLNWLIHAAGTCGSLLIDGLIDGLWFDQNDRAYSEQADVALNILQAARSRFSRTEYIACPSCGRTLFDIETTLQKIRQKTAHLPGLKIAVMGCIVNGPGEMADADYGYVGAGRGEVTLYKGKEAVKKGVPENAAVDELVELIRKNGDWKEPMPS